MPDTPTVETPDVPVYPSPELIEHPYGYFEQMLALGSVHRSKTADEFLVFGHEDIKRVFREHETFTVLGVMPETPFDRGSETMISNRVNEDHSAMRYLAGRPITPGRLKQMESQLARLTDDLIGGFIDKGEMNFMSEFALPIPGLLMCELMDMSKEGDEGRIILHHWADMVAAGDGTADGADYGDESLEGHAFSLTDMLELFENKLRERYEDTSGDDMLSNYLKLQVDRDGEPNFDHLTVMATEMLVGGAGTTALMFTNALWLLLTNPEEMAKVRADHSLIPGMLEESLRMESVVQERERVALKDTELGGVKIPAGSRLRLVLAAGNRDPEVFEDAEEFKVDRPLRVQKDNFGFGYGIHTCLGAPLARLEGKIAFERLFDRIGDIRLSDKNDYTHVYSTHFRSFKELWIEFDAK